MCLSSPTVAGQVGLRGLLCAGSAGQLRQRLLPRRRDGRAALAHPHAPPPREFPGHPRRHGRRRRRSLRRQDPQGRQRSRLRPRRPHLRRDADDPGTRPATGPCVSDRLAGGATADPAVDPAPRRNPHCPRDAPSARDDGEPRLRRRTGHTQGNLPNRRTRPTAAPPVPVGPCPRPTTTPRPSHGVYLVSLVLVYQGQTSWSSVSPATRSSWPGVP